MSIKKIAIVVGSDPYVMRAAEYFKVQVAAVTENQRRFAKTIMFGEIYGKEAPKTAPSQDTRAAAPKRFTHVFFAREDDLSHCKVCGGAEGSLPTLCPERRMTAEESDAVYAGKLNFASGPMTSAKWWTAL